MKHITLFGLILISSLLWQCGSSDDSEPKANLPKNEVNAEAYAFLKTFLGASANTRMQLSKALKPQKADIEAVFIDTAIQRKVGKYIEQLFEKEQFSIRLRAEDKELEVWSVSVSGFKTGDADAIEFPSDFIRVIPFLNDELTFHRFKFKIKNYPSGTSYDGLTKVNGRWVIFPKIWKAIE